MLYPYWQSCWPGVPPFTRAPPPPPPPPSPSSRLATTTTSTDDKRRIRKSLFRNNPRGDSPLQPPRPHLPIPHWPNQPAACLQQTWTPLFIDLHSLAKPSNLFILKVYSALMFDFTFSSFKHFPFCTRSDRIFANFVPFKCVCFHVSTTKNCLFLRWNDDFHSLNR